MKDDINFDYLCHIVDLRNIGIRKKYGGRVRYQPPRISKEIGGVVMELRAKGKNRKIYTSWVISRMDLHCYNLSYVLDLMFKHAERAIDEKLIKIALGIDEKD